MKTQAKIRFMLCCLLICSFILPTNLAAASSESGGAAFQLGTTLFEQGQQIDYALRILKDSSFDWVAIEVDWAKIQPELSQPIHIQNLDLIFRTLGSSQQKLFIRLVNAPQWALTPAGPDIQAVVQCIAQIINLYPAVQAIEVFPGANLQRLWGAVPSAEHYMELLTSLSAYFHQNQKDTMLVVGGFMQVDLTQNEQGISDLTYLQAMYDFGLRDLPAVISLQFENISADPEVPAGSSNDATMRHYELIRQVMINNLDQSRLIWVTKLTPPGQMHGTNLVEKQAQWMEKALTLIRSQLYIQVCILQPINPDNNASGSLYSLITKEGTLNPIISIFPFYALKLNDPFSNNVLKLVKQKQNLSKQR